MDGKETLALVNAILNAISGLLLVAGYVQIRRGNRRAHGWLMATATVVSAIFLICYLTSYAVFGDRTTASIGVIPPAIKWGYLIFLLLHVLAAIVVLPFIFGALWQAYRRRFDRHVRFSRPAFWIWMYVSVTGVMVYLLLYHVLPAIAVKEAA